MSDKLDRWVVKLDLDDSNVIKGIKSLNAKLSAMSKKMERLNSKVVQNELKLHNAAFKQEMAMNKQLHSQKIADSKAYQKQLTTEAKLNKDNAKTALINSRKQAIEDRRSKAAMPANTRSNRRNLSDEQRDKNIQGVLERMAVGRIQVAEHGLRKLEGKGGASAAAARMGLDTQLKSLNEQKAGVGLIKANDIDAINKFKNELQKTGGVVKELSTRASRLRGKFTALEAVTRNLTGTMASMALQMVSFYAVMEGGRFIFNTIIEFESLNASMLMATGGAAAAAESMQFLKRTAFELGTDLTASVKGFQQIGTAGRAAGMSTSEVEKMFYNASIAARAAGLSVDDTDGVFRAFSQILSKGKVQAEELRGQLGDRLPGAFTIFAESMGVTTEQLDAMLKAGEVGAEHLIKFTDLLAKKSVDSGAFAAGLETIQAGMNRVVSAAKVFITEVFGDGKGLGDFFTDLSVAILESISIFKMVGKVISWALYPFKLLGDAIGWLMKLFGFEQGGLVLAIGLVTAALAALGAAGMVSLVGYIVSTLGPVLAGLNALLWGGAAAATAMKKALRGLLIVSGFGAALAIGSIGLEKAMNESSGDNDDEKRIKEMISSIKDPSGSWSKYNSGSSESGSGKSTTVYNTYHITSGSSPSDIQRYTNGVLAKEQAR